jgi:hypothetical protein
LRFSRTLVAGAMIAFGLAEPGIGQVSSPIAVVPQHIPADSGDTIVKVSGRGFTAASQILWNGSPRETRFADSRTLRVRITAQDVRDPGLAEVRISDRPAPPPEEAVYVSVYVPVRANDLVWDSQRGRVYVSVTPDDPNGPSIGVLNPQTGLIERYIPLRERADALALSSDLRYLYAGMNRLVRRLDLSTGGPPVDIETVDYVQRILPFPSQPLSIFVNGVWGSAIIDGTSTRWSGGNVLCPIGLPDDAGLLTKFNDIFELQPISARGFDGPSRILARGALESLACPTLVGGRIYTDEGDVLSPVGPTNLGRFGAFGWPAPATERNRTYFLGTDNKVSGARIRLMVFSSDRQQLLRSYAFPGISDVNYSRIVAWGTDGVAFVSPPGSFTPSIGIHLVRVKD